MLTFQFLKVQAGKIVAGNEVKLDCTFADTAFEITHAPQTKTIKAVANADYDGITVSVKISGIGGGKISMSYSPNLLATIFDLPAFNWNPVTEVLTFNVVEKVPGSYDFTGTVNLIDVKFYQESGTVHVYVE